MLKTSFSPKNGKPVPVVGVFRRGLDHPLDGRILNALVTLDKNGLDALFSEGRTNAGRQYNNRQCNGKHADVPIKHGFT